MASFKHAVLVKTGGKGGVIPTDFHVWIAWQSNENDKDDINGFSNEPIEHAKWIGIATGKARKQSKTSINPTVYKWVPINRALGASGGVSKSELNHVISILRNDFAKMETSFGNLLTIEQEQSNKINTISVDVRASQDDIVRQTNSINNIITDVNQNKTAINDHQNEITLIKNNVANLPYGKQISDLGNIVNNNANKTVDTFNQQSKNFTDITNVVAKKLEDVEKKVDAIQAVGGNVNQAQVELNRTNIEKLENEKADKTAVDALTATVGNIQGVAGVAGKDGKDGKDAIQYYTHIQFSNYQDGKTSRGQTVFGTAGAEYMGVITNSTEKDAPQDADQYTWVRTRGMDGVEGAKGDAGRDSPEKYMHIVFSDFNNGIGVDGNASFKDIGAYIGIIVNSLSKDQPTDPKLYKWLRVLGKSGADGADGSSENIHVAYSKFEDGIDPSDNKSKIFTSYPADDDDRKYFGIAIVNSRRPPDKAQSYRWAKFGAEPKYTHFVYSKFSTGKNSNGVPELITKYSPDNEKVYIGILNNSDYATAPTDPDVYTWHKTGIAEPALQMRIIYSKYANGKNPQGWADFVLDPKGDPSYKYVGIRYNVSENEPQGASQDSIGKFSFSKLTTEKGDRGEKGDKGTASILSLRYSSTSDGKKSDGSSNFSYMSKDTDRYVGFYIGEESYTGTNADDLQWVRLTGEKGDTGDTGKSLKTYIKFSDYQYGLDDAGVSQLFDDATGKKFIGFQLNSQFDVASSDAKDYLWYSLGKGEKGDDGKSLYTHIVYSKYSNGVDTKKNQVSFSTTSARDTEYVGIRPNQKSETIHNTSDPTTYQWFKVKGKIDLTPIRTSITNIETKVTTLETEVANLKANPVAPVNPDPNVPLPTGDLKDITDKLNKFSADVTALTPQVAQNTARLDTLGTASTANGTLSKENATKITVLQDADRAIGGRIDNVVASVTAVDNRVNNLVVNAGSVAQGEIQTVKDSVNKLREDHKKELDRLQDKKASYSTVDQIRVEIGEVKGEMGDIKKNNQETTDKINRFEQEHNRFIKKDAVTSITDPIRLDVDALKKEIIDAKQVASYASSASALSIKNQTKIDTIEPKLTDLETKIQTLSDDVSKVQVSKGATTQELADLDKKLSDEIKAIDTTMEAKVNSFVDKKLKANPPAGAGNVDLTPINNEIDQLKQTIANLENQIKAMQCSKVELKYSANADGSGFTDAKDANTKFVGIKVEKC